jgi:hypothetical protein
MKGRRRDDTPISNLPGDVQPGDYWRVLNSDGTPATSDAKSNLTGAVWMVAAPMPNGDPGIARIPLHTVREEPDGTISVRPGDGSSNSIKITGHEGGWHGYIEHGEWRPV